MQQPQDPDLVTRYVRRTKPRTLGQLGEPPESVTKIPGATLTPPSPPNSTQRPSSPPPSQDPVPPDNDPPPTPSSPSPPSPPSPTEHPEASPAIVAAALPAPTVSFVPPSTSVSSAPPVPPAQPATPSNNPNRPRKRFRKKVNHFFGYHTELKRRLEKLHVHTDSAVLYGTPDSERADDEPLLPPLPRPRPPPPPSVEIPLDRALEEKLKALSAAAMKTHKTVSGLGDSASKEDDMCDDNDSLASFDSPAFIATATRLVGSAEKLKTLRKYMGSLSLLNNERFIEELDLGSSSDVNDGKKSSGQQSKTPRIVPPKLPSLHSSDLESQAGEDLPQFASPTSVERTAIPAMLRRKVKRSDRGYCSSDVLRARLQGSTLAEVAASPITRRRGERRSKSTKIRVRKLDLGAGGEPRRSQRHRRKMEERQRVDTDSEDSSSSEEVHRRNMIVRTVPKDTGSRVDDSRAANDPLSMLLQADAELEKRNLMKKRKRESEVNGEDHQAEGASSSRKIRPRTRRSSKQR